MDPQARVVSRYLTRLVVFGGVFVILCGVLGVSFLLRTEGGDVMCEGEGGDSNFGELSWSYFPPGPKCTWTEEQNGFADEEGPSVFWTTNSTVALVLLALAVHSGWKYLVQVRRGEAEWRSRGT